MIPSKKKKETAQISTASMPDIIFMLLIFFMVSTVFREFRGIPVKIPSAVNANKIEGKRNITYCYIDVNKRIMIDDKLLTTKELTPMMYLKRTQNPRVIVSLKVDENAKNSILDQVQKSLQEADARRIVYASTTK
ncbi:MAG: biopolymer transporter ExbD [Candidatus Delongbacteria bacterium]|nr:biopolymer transporter ExbD [Candidatus Delongbacteria bacterium]